MDSLNANSAVGALALIIVLVGMLFLYAIPSIFTTWQLYKKAGHPGWAAIVPVYGSMIMAKIADKPLWLGAVVGVLGLAGNGFRSDQSPSAIASVLFLAWLGFGLYLLNAFIKKFDRGLGFWFLYIFLPIVTMFTVKNANYKGLNGPTPTALGQMPFTPQPPVSPQPPQTLQPPTSPAFVQQPAVAPAAPAAAPVQPPQSPIQRM